MIKDDLTLFRELADELLSLESTQPVAKPLPASQLFDILDLSLKNEPMARGEFEDLLRELIKVTPKTSSNRFFNQLFGGRQSQSVLGDLLTVLLNNSMYTYKVAGPMVGVEKAIIREVCDIIDYPETADGTIASGGSLTNLMAMLMARDKKETEVRRKGITKKMILYTSAVSHYSIPKNASFIGIGRDQVRYVDVDEQGRMLVSDLEAKVKQDMADGSLPFMVNATAGTTVLGAFDPIRAIHEVCQQHDLWLHVDGAYCGAVIFSETYRHLVDGVELSDSFSFNAHKMLNTTLTCSVIVTQKKAHLYSSFANEATYLYQTDDDEFNLGKTSLQCGRRNDALKLWTMWKSIGTKGLKEMVDHQFHLANIARDYIRRHDDYELYSFDGSLSVCFNYKNIPPAELCMRLYNEGQLMVGHGIFRTQQFVRLVLVNPQNTADEVLAFFKHLESFANDHF